MKKSNLAIPFSLVAVIVVMTGTIIGAAELMVKDSNRAAVIGGSIAEQKPYSSDIEAITNDYLIRDNIKHTIVVDITGGGDYVNISDAVKAITDSSFANQYEIQIRPGRYKNEMLVPPPYCTIRGMIPGSVILWTNSQDPAHQEIVNAGYSGRYINLIFDANYVGNNCMRFDSPTLSNAVIIVENCQFTHKGNGRGPRMPVGGAAWPNLKIVFRQCQFTGYANVIAWHNKENTDYAVDLKFLGCSFVNGFSAGSVGGFNASTLEFSGCTFYGGVVTGYISNLRNVPELWKYPANRNEWIITGYGNKGFVYIPPEDTDGGEGLLLTAVNYNADITISGTAVLSLFGETYKTTLANNRIKGKLYGYADVRDVQSGLVPYSKPNDVIQMWKRLGDCSVTNKTLTVTVGGKPQTYTFDQNYLASKTVETVLLSQVNTVITNAVMSKYNGQDNYDNIRMPERIDSCVGESNGLIKNELISIKGYKAYLSPQGSKSISISGIAVSEAKEGESIQIWSGNYFIKLPDGEYGVGADNQLSIGEVVKIGYVKNNVFYPFY